MTDRNYRRWNDFLKPLPVSSKKSQEHKKLTEIRAVNSLSADLAGQLSLEREKHKNAEDQVDNLTESLTACKLGEEIAKANVEAGGEECEEESDDVVDAGDQQTRLKSSSKWTVEELAKYVDFEKYVRKLDIHPSEIDYNIIKETIEQQKSISKLNDIHKESDARMYIDKLLQAICKPYDVKLQTEVRSTVQYLPNSTFDYLFHNKHGTPFGCVEAKYPQTLIRKSFVQAVAQLSCLQQMSSKEDATTEVETRPVFSVLTDSHRFVFIKLQGRELRLEQEGEGTGNVLKVRCLDIEKEESFKEILGTLKTFMDLSVEQPQLE